MNVALLAAEWVLRQRIQRASAFYVREPSFERVLQQRGLRVELRRVADVLPRAASAAAEDWAHGIGPYGAGGEQLLHASARKPLLQVHHADPHPVDRISRSRRGRKFGQ